MSVRATLPCLAAALIFTAAVAGEPPAPVKIKIPARSAAAAAQRLPARDARRDAIKKLGEAVKKEREARAALAAAEKAAAAQVEQSEKRIAQLRQKLAEARRAVANQRTVVLRSSSTYRNAIAVREDIDASDPVERFALLTPGGPVVMQVATTIDGQPARAKREALIDDLLAIADTDQDQKPTWKEALATPRFTMGRVQVVNPGQQATLLRTYDTNGNGLVDRVECRRFISQVLRAPAFSLSGVASRFLYRANGAVYVQAAGQTSVYKLLDTDEDGELSDAEIENAEARFKSRDADDNDLLDASELSGAPAGNNRRLQAIRGRQTGGTPMLAVLLGPTATAKSLFQGIRNRYQDEQGKVLASSFEALPELFQTLDKNGDGELQQAEAWALNQIEPHVALTVRLGKNENDKGLSIASLSSKIDKGDVSKQSLVAMLPGIRLTFAVQPSNGRTIDYSQFGKSYVGRFDKNNNGYLEKDELPVNLAMQFANWDIDGDGKAYPKEVAKSYERAAEPELSRVTASATREGDPLMEALDLSGDRRLSLREMKTAAGRLKKFDTNADARISRGEVPAALVVRFRVGTQTQYTYLQAAQVRRPAAPRAAPDGAPEWFARMDRNGDGDVTLKEFLGGKEQFQKLDTNGDGFIEPKEAKAASDSK